MAERIKVGEKWYTKESCHSTEAAAKSKAEKVRSEGKNARVVDNCVYTRKPARVNGKKSSVGKKSQKAKK